MTPSYTDPSPPKKQEAVKYKNQNFMNPLDRGDGAKNYPSQALAQPFAD